MHADFKGKVIVVSGASAGVGRAVAREFGRRGAKLALLARDRQRLETACREVFELGGEAIPIAGDVADPDFVEQAAARAERELGPLDVWVNNAMVTILAAVDSITPREFQRVTEVTYLGTVYGTMSALERMKTRGRGTIVQVGSAMTRHREWLWAGCLAAVGLAGGMTLAAMCQARTQD